VFLNPKTLIATFSLLALCACGTVPTPPPLSPHEQMSVDTAQAKGLLVEFEKQVQFVHSPNVEKYLIAVARQVSREDDSLKNEKIVVRIHQDSRPELKRLFSFPGVVISIPASFLHDIAFENELAAVIALELAQVERRELAREMEKNDHPILFGDLSIFHFAQKSRAESIELGTKLMYAAGYDPRGMAAIFQKYGSYYIDTETPTSSKELSFYVREAQRAKNDFMPSLQPIVRSNDFLRMKKELKSSS